MDDKCEDEPPACVVTDTAAGDPCCEGVLIDLCFSAMRSLTGQASCFQASISGELYPPSSEALAEARQTASEINTSVGIATNHSYGSCSHACSGNMDFLSALNFQTRSCISPQQHLESARCAAAVFQFL